MRRSRWARVWLRPRWFSVRQANDDGQHGVRREERDRRPARRPGRRAARARRPGPTPTASLTSRLGTSSRRRRGTVCSETTHSPTVRPKPSTSTASTANGTPHWRAAWTCRLTSRGAHVAQVDLDAPVGQRRGGAGERDEQHVAREADQPAAERDRGRQHHLPGAAAYDEDREQRADRGPEGVDDEVVDVEEPVGAGVEVPDAGLLGELDEQRERRTRRGSRPPRRGAGSPGGSSRAARTAGRSARSAGTPVLGAGPAARRAAGRGSAPASRAPAAGCPCTGRCGPPASAAACRSRSPARRPPR